MLGVVVDQQPAVPPAQLVKQHTELGVLVAEFGQAQPQSQPSQPAGNSQRLFGRHPPDQVVVGRVPVGVLDGELGLADPTQPMDCAGLHHGPPLLGLQQASQGREQLPAADEVRVAGRHPEHLR
jgi:hypothetical protein